MAPSSHTATSGVTWGRPSARTVETQNSSAVSSTRRVSSQPVATVSGSLKRGSIFVTGSFIKRTPFDRSVGVERRTHVGRLDGSPPHATHPAVKAIRARRSPKKKDLGGDEASFVWLILWRVTPCP